MLRRPLLIVVLLSLCGAVSARTAEPSPAQLKDIATVAGQGRGNAAGRAAWERLSAAGPEILPDVLRAMDTPQVPAANWLRTIFDRILDRALQAGGRDIDVAALLAFAKDAKRQGRARRLALETVERLRPGTTARLVPGWLGDPEFRYEAVAALLAQGKDLAKKGQKPEATAIYRQALDASRDMKQGKEAAAGLLGLGIHASVAEHLGFLTDWYLIGPFDGMNMKGFHTMYPPERKVDLGAELDGKSGKVRWKRYRVQEEAATSTGRHVVLVNLRKRDALGDADDAVAFAYTEFTVPQARVVEFRGSADDNFIVYVNGQRVFGFEEYRNGVRHDRHRFRVPLRAGKNTVLVKISQTPAPNPEPNWEFFLRVVDDTGKGIAMQDALPPEQK